MEVKILKKKDKAALVEWVEDGIPYRATMPSSALRGNVTSKAKLAMAIPYGVPWASLLVRAEMEENRAERIEHELHKVGIWTADDAGRNGAAVRSAFNSAVGEDLRALLRVVKSQVKR